MSQRNPPKLYLNENIPFHLVELLASYGITAIHTLDVNNKGTSDEFQLQYAVDRGYIMITHNRRDFRQLHAQWIQAGKFHYGILVMGHGEPTYLASRIKRFFDYHFTSIRPPFCDSPPP